MFLWRMTTMALGEMPADLTAVIGGFESTQVTDRYGLTLNYTYTNKWNVHDFVDLHDVPELLLTAFIQAEDKRFYKHTGQDWWARLHAVETNVLAGKTLRGASTITEQVVRMLRPRPRTIWSRWLEGWEARRLENQHAKSAILEFYVNQVPYAENRRGIVQAARYYFDRDLNTLSQREMLALAVLVRAPSRLDPWYGDGEALDARINLLADTLFNSGVELLQDESKTELTLRKPNLPVNAHHFVSHVRRHTDPRSTRLETTLDGRVQQQLQELLDQRLRFLSRNNVNNAAALVADHQSGEILAWVVGSLGVETPGRLIDAVRAPRQPGSALKPFLYALALEKGWTAATIIEDSPLSTSIGHGRHDYRNYSDSFYGPVTLRQALGNSLNIPALKTLEIVGIFDYVETLEQLGIQGLDRQLDHYGDGLALGNGEVSLFELTQAYATLANRGVFQELVVRSEQFVASPPNRVYSAEVASLIGNVLSDPHARELEFEGGLLNFPHQTAVKTGTSSDYRDSWAMGFNDRYVAGVWMGNLNHEAMSKVTGAIGPTLVLRATFDILNRQRKTQPLWLSPNLVTGNICARSITDSTDDESCRQLEEYFVRETVPNKNFVADTTVVGATQSITISQPSDNLHMAIDPRIPPEHQALEFHIAGVTETDRVEWLFANGDIVETRGPKYEWPLIRGTHTVRARVWREGKLLTTVAEKPFEVR